MNGGGDGRAWYVESVGHYRHPDTELDEWSQSYHPEVIDRIERISDGESLRVLHRLAREEGLLLGGSSGTAIAAALRVARVLGPEDVVVVTAPDSGRGYLSKYFDDGWLGQYGFPLLAAHGEPTVGAVFGVADGARSAGAGTSVLAEARLLPSTTTVSSARGELASRRSLPVVLARRSAGPVVVAEVLGTATQARLVGAPDADPVGAHLDPPPAFAGTTEPVGAAVTRLAEHHGEVLIVHEGQVVGGVVAAAFVAAVVRADAS